MAHRATMVLVAMVILLASQSIYVVAQTSCATAIIGLAPCLSYVSSNSETPSSSCCSQLSSIVKSQPQCLCMVLNNGGSIGISINKTRALDLPGACRVQTPPVSQCNAGSGGSTSSPAKSPAMAPTSPSAAPTSPSAAPTSPARPSSNPAPSTSPSTSPSTKTAPSANE